MAWLTIHVSSANVHETGGTKEGVICLSDLDVNNTCVHQRQDTASVILKFTKIITL